MRHERKEIPAKSDGGGFMMVSTTEEIRVAVDIGGTFTDLVLENRALGQTSIVKVPSTPPDYSEGFARALSDLDIPASSIAMIFHGTTAPLNALLERRGVACALVTTKGFADVYKIGRGNRTRMYDIHYRNPDPLIPRNRIFEVVERMSADGSVVEALDQASIAAVIEQLRQLEIEAVGICLLHSYANPVHEEILRDRLGAALDGVSVYASFEVCREWREFERTSTTAINASISPVLSRYLGNLRDRLHRLGYASPLFLMQSNGGLIDAHLAEDRAVLTLMSGPVGGIAGCLALGRDLNLGNLICIDMGGTSFDFGLIRDGQAGVTAQREIMGYPILAPSVDIHTIGAGGGSIAWAEGGALRVGPRSAGAQPGPACYGRGGVEATVTDANLVLGRIDPDRFLGGKMRLAPDLAVRAINRLADELAMDSTRLAEGILAVVNGKMANAIRSITIGRGLDPRDFSLVAYGGAGPLHAASIAEELGVGHVIVPSGAGVFSAWGMLQSDVRHERSRTVLRPLCAEALAGLEPIFEQLRNELTDLLRSEGIPPHRMSFRRWLDMRYAGQEYYVGLPLAEDDRPLGKADPSAIKQRFDDLYENRYGHKNLAEDIEVVNVRLEAIGVVRDVDDLPRCKAGGWPQCVPQEEMPSAGRSNRVMPHVRREDLAVHGPLEGPALLSESSCTTFVPEGWTVHSDATMHLHLVRKE